MKKQAALLLILLSCTAVHAQKPDTSITSRQLKQLRDYMHLYSEVMAHRKDAVTQELDPVFQININANVLDSMFKYLPVLPQFSGQSQDEPSDSLLLYFSRMLNRPHRTQRQGIVKFGDNALVGRNEIVNGDVVVVGGDADIYGEVEGGVIVVMGNIRLTSTSIVNGDVVSVWGGTDIDNGARILGTTNIFNFGKILSPDFFKVSNMAFMPLLLRIIGFLVLFSMMALLYYSFKKPTELVSIHVSRFYVKSGVVGIIGILGMPAVFLILITTIIGIPVALFVLPLAIIAAFLMGITGCSLAVGRHILPRTGIKTESPAAALITGLFAIQLPAMLAKLLGFFSATLETTFALAAIIVILLAWIPGFGGVILTRFGRRSQLD